MSDRRERLPNRRVAETLEFVHAGPTGSHHKYRATLGFYENGQLGEIFLSSNKTGTDLFVASQEVGLLASFALQAGIAPETLRESTPRTSEGKPETALGTLLDILAERGKGPVKV